MEIIVLLVILGLLFDYTNGFHDAANVVSTVIATRVLSPLCAIILAAILNGIGAISSSKVAETITSGIIDTKLVTQQTTLSAVLGAIVWNLLTWYRGIPSSSSYALIGGMIGPVVLESGWHAPLWQEIGAKVILPMFLSPIVGFLIALGFMKGIVLLSRGKQFQGVFRICQIGSASCVAFAHGLNDAQKSMGIITLALFASGNIGSLHIPLWVTLSCAIVMGLGTASGGFRIIRTVGFQITKLTPAQGFVVETSAASVMIGSSLAGIPISSTHMIVGSVAGAGVARHVSAIQIPTLHRVGLAWLFTIPGSAILAGLIHSIIRPSL